MEKEKPYLPFEQDGKTYNLYELPDGFVIKGDLDLAGKDFEKLPDLSKVIVEGNFYCHRCYNLTSLKGAPKKVGKGFSCWGCYHLTSLDGASEKVGGYFDCWGCDNLTSLAGAPKEVGRDFDCHNCKSLISLYGSSEKVEGDFRCSDNKNLTSLVGISSARYINCDDGLEKKYGFNRSFSFDEFKSSQVYQEELKEYEEQQKQKKNNILKQKKKNILNSKRLKYKLMRTIAAENVSDEVDEKTGKRKINPKRSTEQKKVIKEVLDSVSKGITD